MGRYWKLINSPVNQLTAGSPWTSWIWIWFYTLKQIYFGCYMCMFVCVIQNLYIEFKQETYFKSDHFFSPFMIICIRSIVSLSIVLLLQSIMRPHNSSYKHSYGRYVFLHFIRLYYICTLSIVRIDVVETVVYPGTIGKFLYSLSLSFTQRSYSLD